jgi:hypothetical protein
MIKPNTKVKMNFMGRQLSVVPTMLASQNYSTIALAASSGTRGLPACLDVETTAKLLGIAVSDIQVLMAAGKLTPLGDPAPNAPKWFAAVETIRLATDQDGLHQATKEIAKCPTRTPFKIDALAIPAEF